MIMILNKLRANILFLATSIILPCMSQFLKKKGLDCVFKAYLRGILTKKPALLGLPQYI